MRLSQRVRSSGCPSDNPPREGRSRSLASSSAAQRSRMPSDVLSSRTSGPIPLSSLPDKPGRTRGNAPFRQIVAQERGRRGARRGQAHGRLQRMSKSANSGEAPSLFACSYFTGSPEFHVLETDANAVHCCRHSWLIRRAPNSVGSHVGWNDASAVSQRLRFRVPGRLLDTYRSRASAPACSRFRAP